MRSAAAVRRALDLASILGRRLHVLTPRVGIQGAVYLWQKADDLAWPIHDDGYAGKTQEPTDQIETVWRDAIELPPP